MATPANRRGGEEKSVPHIRITDEKYLWDNYEEGDLIGQGTFGKVFKVRHKETGIDWAMKVINKEKAGGQGIKLLEREVTILKRVQHENIIALNEVYESPKRMYLMMEYCEGGELKDGLDKSIYTESETLTIVRKLASAIKYLHKLDIVHRDLKLENILLSQNPDDPDDKLHIKVTDFGLSVVKGGVGHDNMMQDFCGTPIYMSPEIIDNKSYSQQCDVWAMGVIVYMLISGSPPFKSKDEETLYDLIKKGEIDFSGPVWEDISANAKHCIQGMLKIDPAHRLAASEVLNHPWITGEHRESSEPTNVLEMMKLWKDDLKKEEGENNKNNEGEEGQNSAMSNGDITGDNVQINIEDSSCSSEKQNGTDDSSTNKENTKVKDASSNKTTETRKGSGGTKKPGSGGKSGAANRMSTGNSHKTGLNPPGQRSTGSRSPAPNKLQTSTNNNTVGKTAPNISKTNTVHKGKATTSKK